MNSKCRTDHLNSECDVLIEPNRCQLRGCPSEARELASILFCCSMHICPYAQDRYNTC